MTPGKTVLMMSRGPRLHRLFCDVAADLSRDHRVVVLAAPEEVDGFSRVGALDVRRYASPDIETVRDYPRWPEPELRTMAARIEREIGLNVYKSASNYLLYGRIVRSYGGRWGYLETEREILNAYVAAYVQLSGIFDECAPDVVFYETIDLISSYVAFALARSRGKFALDFRFAPLTHGNIAIGFGLHKRNVVLEHLFAHPDAIEAANLKLADEVLADARQHMSTSGYVLHHKRLASDPAPRPWRRLRPTVSSCKQLGRGLRNLRWHYRALRNARWLRRRLTTRIPDQPYLAFFLAHLPEAATCAQAPRWVYQDAIIEQLAINAPSDLLVVTKEHPRTYGRRGRDFFGPLLRLPNVRVCTPSVDSYGLLAAAKAVIAVGGSAGLEALLLGKRVGVLGRPFYSVFPGVRRLEHPDEIYTAMEDPTWQPERMVKERRTFLAAYLQAAHPFSLDGSQSVNVPGGGARLADALRATVGYTERHRLGPSGFDAGF